LVPTTWGNYDSPLIQRKNLTVKSLSMIGSDPTILKKISSLLDENSIKVHIEHIFPLSKAAKAQEKSESNRVRGKIILQIT